MAIVRSENRNHNAVTISSEMARQVDVAAAIAAGGSSATVAAAVKTAEIAHYRRLRDSAVANGVDSACFGEALRSLGTGGV